MEFSGHSRDSYTYTHNPEPSIFASSVVGDLRANYNVVTRIQQQNTNIQAFCRPELYSDFFETTKLWQFINYNTFTGANQALCEMVLREKSGTEGARWYWDIKLVPGNTMDFGDWSHGAF